jgi:hypothetical protein
MGRPGQGLQWLEQGRHRVDPRWRGTVQDGWVRDDPSRGETARAAAAEPMADRVGGDLVEAAAAKIRAGMAS